MRYVSQFVLFFMRYSTGKVSNSKSDQNLITLASAVPKIWLVPTNILMVYVTWPRPFLGLVLATMNLPTKFEVTISTHYHWICGQKFFTAIRNSSRVHNGIFKDNSWQFTDVFVLLRTFIRSPTVNKWRQDEARPLVSISALCCLQCLTLTV